MPEDSYPYGMIKKGYKLARKYLGADDDDQPASTTPATKPAVQPGKTRAQIASEEAAMNKGTENLTQTQPKTATPTGRDAADETAVKPTPKAAPTYQRSRSLLQGAKDAGLDKATTTTDPETGEKKKKGFGLATAAKSFLGGR